MVFKKKILSIALALCVIAAAIGVAGKGMDVKADEPGYYLVIDTPVYYGYYGVDFSKGSEVTLKWGYYPTGNVDDVNWENYSNILDSDTRMDMVMDDYILKGYGKTQTSVDWRVSESIKVKKSQFTEKDEEGNYIYHIYGVYDWHDEWVDGKWFESNGSQTYKSKGSWKGSGTLFWYETEDGWYPSSCWQKINHQWYYFKDNGYCACSEWLDINGSWYYFDKNGYYEYESWIDGYWINEDGTQTYPKKASWYNDSTGWYYMDESGWYPKSDFVWIDGENYYFKDNGYMACNETLVIEDEYKGEKYKLKYIFDSKGAVIDYKGVDE